MESYRSNEISFGQRLANPRAPIGQVTCPNCRVVMPRVSLKNGEEKDLNEAVYHCPKCSTETRRWIKI